MRRVVRNPLAATDPSAVPYLSGNSWWDFGFGPVCRRLLAKYGVALPTGHREPPGPGPVARGAVGVDQDAVPMTPLSEWGPGRKSA